MPLNQQQVKHAPVSKEVWKQQRTQVGGLWFDPRTIRPLGDHILVELDQEAAPSSVIAAPDVAKNQDIIQRTGTVLAAGPGKWKEKRVHTESWVDNREYFARTVLKPGDRVIIGHYSDWESWHSDYEGRGANIVLCQEADVRVVVSEKS